jgi:hypothetical protein
MSDCRHQTNALPKLYLTEGWRALHRSTADNLVCAGPDPVCEHGPTIHPQWYPDESARQDWLWWR